MGIKTEQKLLHVMRPWKSQKFILYHFLQQNKFYTYYNEMKNFELEKLKTKIMVLIMM